MLSNCGHDSRGQYSGDTAGDQGGEWALVNWYNYPYGGWNYILRHPSPAIRYYIKEFAIQAAQNDMIGYDQSERTSFWNQLSVSGYYPMNITVPCEADCSSGVLAIVKAVGYVVGDRSLQNVSQYGYTGNERSILTAAGFQALSDSKYLTGDSYLCAGDVLLNEENHTCICVTDGIYAETSSSEKTSDNADARSPIQLQAEVSESLFPSDGSTSWVTVDFYITSLDVPSGTYSSGNIVSTTPVTQTIACGLNGSSTIYSLNSVDIANKINNFGDRYLVATQSVPAPRNANGNAVVRITSSGTFTWLSGSPLRTLDKNYSCIKLKYTMTYNANEGNLGEVPPIDYRCHGHATPITSKIPIRSGYDFFGWSTIPNGDVEYKYGDTYSADANITLYAVWGAKISASNISMSSTGSIEIPGREYAISGAGKYVFCDHTYYYNLNYDITNVLTAIDPDNPVISKLFTSITAQPFYVDDSSGRIAYVPNNLESTPQQITSPKGIVSIAMPTLAKSISNFGSTSSVLLGVRFTFVQGDTTKTVDKLITIPLKNFGFVDMSLESVAYNPANSAQYLIRLKVTYPASFETIRTKNLYPYIRYGNMSQNNVLVYESREDISEGVSIFTYKATASIAGANLTMKWVGDILTYDTDWNSGFPASAELTKEMTVSMPTSPSSTITIFRNGTCRANEFIESEYTQGFFKGGEAIAKQFSETNRMALLPSGFEFIELRELDEP